MAVVTGAQKRAWIQENEIESQERTQEENVTKTQEECRDTASEIHGGVIGMQDDGLWEREFPLNDELFEEQKKTRSHLTRNERRKHNQQWIRAINGSTSTQLKKTGGRSMHPKMDGTGGLHSNQTG